MQPPFAAAAGGPSSLATSLRFNPVPDEDLLPETRKEIAEEMWDIILSHVIDCIFDDRLPPAEEYAYTETPLDSVPLLDPAAWKPRLMRFVQLLRNFPRKASGMSQHFSESRTFRNQGRDRERRQRRGRLRLGHDRRRNFPYESRRRSAGDLETTRPGDARRGVGAGGTHCRTQTGRAILGKPSEAHVVCVRVLNNHSC